MYRNTTLAIELLAIALAALLSYSTAYAGLEEGRAAYQREDYRAAFAEFQPLAEQGNLRAQAMIGWMYAQGLGVRKNAKEALKWLQRAGSADGNPDSAKAQHNLGVMYENGLGVTRDLKKAAYWYSRGAQNGDPSAQSNLGTLYLDGSGVEKDPSKGIFWLTKAAEQGDPEAYTNLGRVYFEGIGVPKNWALSYFFLYMAANHSGRDVPNARENLQIVRSKLSPSQLAEGRRLVKEALSKR